MITFNHLNLNRLMDDILMLSSLNGETPILKYPICEAKKIQELSMKTLLFSIPMAVFFTTISCSKSQTGSAALSIEAVETGTSALFQDLQKAVAAKPEIISQAQGNQSLSITSFIGDLGSSATDLSVKTVVNSLNAKFGSIVKFTTAQKLSWTKITNAEVKNYLDASKLGPDSLGRFSSNTYDERLKILAECIKVDLMLKVAGISPKPSLALTVAIKREDTPPSHNYTSVARDVTPAQAPCAEGMVYVGDGTCVPKPRHNVAEENELGQTPEEELNAACAANQCGG